MEDLPSNNKKYLLNRSNVKYIIPVIHFLLTFLWERILFKFSGNLNPGATLVRNKYVSDTVEWALVYIASKVFAGIIIWLLWKLIFGIIEKKIPRKIMLLFGMIFLIGFIAGVFGYPDIFGIEIDNYTNFSAVIRFLPTYWQSVFTGAVYAGCMMVIPHPFSIFIFQWLSFVAVVAYIYSGVERFMGGNKKVKYILLFLFILPESSYIMFNAYRNNFYTILCLFYFSYLLFSTRDEECGLKRMVIIALLSSFIMVWRSEGILIGLGGMLLLFLSTYKKYGDKVIAVVLVFVATFIFLNNFQGIGSEKYYGRDYMILNTTNVLYSIFNDPNVNLAYEGAEDDLAAIEAVIPVEVLKEMGMTGYRNYNWTVGRADFNQTMATDEAADAYMSAYYRIIFHNVVDYLDVQINFFYNSLQLSASHETYSYSGDTYIDLEQFVYDGWVTGRDELAQTFLTVEWGNNQIRVFIFSIISFFMSVWSELLTLSGINTLLHVGAILADVFIWTRELVNLFIQKGNRNLKYFIIFTILLGETVAIMLFMPEGRQAYMYPMLYSSYLLIYFYILDLTNKNGIIVKKSKFIESVEKE